MKFYFVELRVKHVKCKSKIMLNKTFDRVKDFLSKVPESWLETQIYRLPNKS